MNKLLPPYLENRLTERAKNALISTCGKGADAKPIHLLCALAYENGSLAKNILEAHRINGTQIYAHMHGGRIPRYTKSSVSNKNRPVKFNEDVKRILKKSTQIAAEHNQSFIGTEHILYAIIYNLKNYPQLRTILTANKVSQIKNHLDGIFSQNVDLSSFPHMVKNKLFGSFLMSNPPFARGYGGAKRGKASRVKIKVKKSAASGEEHQHDHAHEHDEARHAGINSKTPALDAFCEDLTALAQAQMLDPVIGREKEISRIINILSRRTKNNPLLVGEPGVGKTAVVQGLAQRIYNGEVPSALLHKIIFSLNLNSLVAGTMFRGDFEARMQDIMDEAYFSNVILFIDEIHTIIGAGSAQGTLDAANILKPSLSQGKIRCIGATTTDEYRKYIERDRALERRLQPVFIEEETEEQSITTLMHLKKIYEKHHDIAIEDDSIRAAVSLSSRYIRDRYLPDKAIDVLDEAAARAKSNSAIKENTKRLRDLERQKDAISKSKERAIKEESYQDAIVLKYKEDVAEQELRQFKKKFPLFNGKTFLTAKDIEETVYEMTAIPPEKTRGLVGLNKLSIALNREIVGQREAISQLVLSIKRNAAGIRGKARHKGSFLFLGPCGVGKTALAKTLARHSAQNILKLDMAEYAEPHTISRLIGSPPGYVGYGEGGELTEKIRRHPHSIVLFDEIEKAHPAVHNLLLSILEDGELDDSLGRKVTFKNATIILTSNAGFEDDEDEDKGPLGFSRPGKLQDAHSGNLGAIKYVLRPEIINRIDKVVTFNPLGKKEILAITKLLAENLKDELSHLDITVSDRAIRYVAQKAYKPGEGARNVRTAVEQYIEGALAEHIIRHRDAKSANIDVKNGKITVS